MTSTDKTLQEDRPTALPTVGMPETALTTGPARLLRPSKVRRALRRRWFEYQVGRFAVVPREHLIHLGTDYGGWVVPEDMIDASWMCWCVGAGQDISFDVALLHEFGAQVRCFDPLPEYGNYARDTAGDEPRFSFHELAIAARDESLTMFAVSENNGGALSGVDVLGGARRYDVQGRTLASLRSEFGDLRIDLLKIDLEGLEYEILPTIDFRELGVRVLCTELHSTGSVSQARRLVHELADVHGFELVHRKHPTSLTFVRR